MKVKKRNVDHAGEKQAFRCDEMFDEDIEGEGITEKELDSKLDGGDTFCGK